MPRELANEGCLVNYASEEDTLGIDFVDAGTDSTKDYGKGIRSKKGKSP